MKNIKILTSTVITCAKYALEELHNDLSGLAGGGCGGSGGGCGCGGSASLLNEDDLKELLEENEGYEVSIINHDNDPDAYYASLKEILIHHQRDAFVDDQTVEYTKSVFNPIIAVDNRIVALGRIPDDFELIEAIENDTFVPINPSAGF